MRMIFAILLIVAGCALVLPSTATLFLCSVNPEPDCGTLLIYVITYLTFGTFMIIVGLVIRKPSAAREQARNDTDSSL